ncbi:MAG: poly(3-hydroxybutyrate) depolymerase [Candidatus Omnitrophota bacterium]|jgi:poly(3-hydroxybutyrate) depolymerase
MKHHYLTCALLLSSVIITPAKEANWTPTLDPAKAQELAVEGRTLEVFRHPSQAAWGYEKPQEDSFVVMHPTTEQKHAPLYVVLHSAGHDVNSCVKCTRQVGNHDIYHAPADFYALYVDCRANGGDWWWGGMHAKDENLTRKNGGLDPVPVERRVIDTVKWVMTTYGIDANRVYLCGNSMGGSGTLGIGLRNGDLFAAIKANVPAGVEHAANRMGFPPFARPANVRIPDPPIVIDYSAPNDQWSFGHDRFVQAMNDRKYPLYAYWGPFGHANNHANILKVNDLINSFDWLSVKKNEAYAVFTNASSNDPLPWPDHLGEKAPGQVNAFFRWKTLEDSKEQLRMSLFLTSANDLKTTFTIPTEARADVSIRRMQHFPVKANESINWVYGKTSGKVTADAEGVVTLPEIQITTKAEVLTLAR